MISCSGVGDEVPLPSPSTASVTESTVPFISRVTSRRARQLKSLEVTFEFLTSNCTVKLPYNSKMCSTNVTFNHFIGKLNSV